MKLKHRAPRFWFCELVGRLREAVPTVAREKPGQLSPLSRLVWASLVALLLSNCNLATLTVQGATGTPAPDQGTVEPVSPPALPAPPAPLAVSLQNPEKSARTLVEALAGRDRLAAWLGLYQALGIPVIGEDGMALDGRDDPIGPVYWQVWYTAGLDLPGHGILLSDAGRLLGLLFGLKPQDAETVGDTLLFDLRFALGSEEPVVRLLGAVARERILRCGSKRDIVDGATTAQTASIDIPMVQLVFWAALRGALAHLPAEPGLPQGGASLVGDPTIRVQATRYFKNCTDAWGDDADVAYWIRWLVGRIGNGLSLSEDVRKAWDIQGKLIPGLIEIVQKALGVAKSTVEVTGKAVGWANGVSAAVSFLMQLAAMDVVGIQNPDRLERTKKTSDGKTATLTWRLMSDPGNLPNGDELQQCVISYITNALGAQLTFPTEKRIAGAELKFEGGAGFPERVLFGDYQQIRSWTNEFGEAELLILGRGQQKELPDTATAVDKEYSVFVSAQPEEAGLNTMANIFLRGLTFGLAPGGAAALRSLIDILKTFTYDMGEHVFPMIDWADGPYEAYASGLGSQFTKKNICDLEKPFAISGSNPGINSFAASFTPTSRTQGNVTFTDASATYKYTATFAGTYKVSFYDHGEGDIQMQGELRTKIEGVKNVIVVQTKFQIAIRYNPDLVCPEN